MELKYSDQAKTLLKNIPNFNKKDFEKWFKENLIIGSNNILTYLLEKEKDNAKH